MLSLMVSKRHSILHGPPSNIRDLRLEDLALQGASIAGADVMCVDVGLKSWTFTEMRELSERVGHALITGGVQPGDFVPVLADHRAETLAAILGLLRVGAVYVPLDRRWPAERIRRVIRRTGARIAIADEAGVEQLLGALEPDDPVKLIAATGQADKWDPDFAASVVELWDTVAEQADDIASAGFALAGRKSGADEIAARRYMDHVVALCEPFITDAARVIDIGAGTGVLGKAFASRTASYVAVDPSPASLRKLLERVHSLGSIVETKVAFAHELNAAAYERADLVLISSCVQFYPSKAYLWRVLEIASQGLHAGARVIVADVLDADRAVSERGQLGIERAFFRSLERVGYTVEIYDRQGDWVDVLKHRYDVILSVKERPNGFARTLDDLAAMSSDRSLPRCLKSQDPAYCIFTSGSTGEPKGVLVSHRAATNIIDWVNTEMGIVPDDRMLSVAPFAFDLSVYDLFGVPAAGATVVFAPQRLLGDPDELADLVEQNSITLWNTAPAAFSFLLTAIPAHHGDHQRRLRRVLLSGDFVPLNTPDELKASFPDAELTVLGGATEATVWSSFHHTPTVDPDWASIPYGSPVANTSYYVLGDDGRPLPLGATGELHIGGEGVAIGYVGDNETTRRKFLPDPWRGEGSRMYATGDLVRITEDGLSWILGRIDSQVKVNGHRIELTEVETALTRNPAVRAAAAWIDLTGRLRAAIVERPDFVADQAGLYQGIGRILPSYMLPASITRVDSLPHSDNGKVARNELTSWVAAHALR